MFLGDPFVPQLTAVVLESECYPRQNVSQMYSTPPSGGVSHHAVDPLRGAFAVEYGLSARDMQRT